MDPTAKVPASRTRRGFIEGVVGAGTAAALAGCLAVEQPQGANHRDAAAEDNWYRSVYEASVPALVEIAAERATQTGQGRGSGFRIGRHTVVTNAHVTAGNDRVDVRDRDLEWDGAEVRSEDVYSDLAVLELDEPADAGNGLGWADATPQIGTRVMALGAPLGFEGSASTGIVSGVNRALPSATGFSIPASIQTDAAINPGSSGGPLLNDQGSVLGVVFAGAAENIGFAISAPVCKQIVPVLADGEEYEHSFVGIAHRDVTPDIAAANDLESVHGVYVTQILPDSPADGILRGTQEEQLQDGEPVEAGGDIILAVDGVETPTGDHLGAYLLLETRPGDTVTFTVYRNESERTLDVTLGTRPDPDEELPVSP